MIGKLNMRTELNLMSHLDVMLSMDSANMHLASLVNIPVVSIWEPPILMPVLWVGNNCRSIPCNSICHAVPVLYMVRSLAGEVIMPV